MQMRIQAMFLAAFAVAYAMLLASMASADGPYTGADSTAALTASHQTAIGHARALAKHLRAVDAAGKDVALGHSDAIGSALHDASQASTSLATEVKAGKAKDCVEAMREHQSDAADKHKQLTDELAQAPLDAEAIRELGREIADELLQAEKENRRVALLERRGPVERATPP